MPTNTNILFKIFLCVTCVYGEFIIIIPNISYNIIILLSIIVVTTYEVPCDILVKVCPQTTVTFTCSVDSERLSWFVPMFQCNTEDQCKLQHVKSDSSSLNITVGVFNAVVVESNATYLSSILTFVVPSEFNEDHEEIVCS